ncbi:Otopetrin-1 [Toxocara canis]|uniref:Otopetrin-1 n=1 Tax=Toxocara canis TaxID=6265 RepID=A0A0B2UXC1_TOXCA|nr:Otopetrin-1 [Toxocara canis]
MSAKNTCALSSPFKHCTPKNRIFHSIIEKLDAELDADVVSRSLATDAAIITPSERSQGIPLQMAMIRTDEEQGLRAESQQLSDILSMSSSMRAENNGGEANDNRWINNKTARRTLLVALTAFYSIIMTIFGLVIELSHLISNEYRRIVHFQDLIFGAYMYGVAIVFFIYCYAVLMVSPGWVALRKITAIIPKTTSRSQIDASICDITTAPVTEQRRVTHSGPSSGSLFLRLGFLVFGVIGVVYYSFSTFLCFIDDDCDSLISTIDIAAIVFIFAQMHFVFCNWRVTITGSRIVARFGTMHLIAANLWTWIRYILIEESVMNNEIREIFHDSNKSEASADGYSDVSHELNVFLSQKAGDHATCKDSECLLGSMTELMYTSIVEYSLIGAAVMFIVWHNIDQVRERNTYVKRKYQIRVDCSKTTSGLFFGLLYLSATLTSMAIFYGYMASKQSEIAATVYGITDVVQYIVSGAGCIYALWRMRLLRFAEHPQQPNSPNSSSQSGIQASLIFIAGKLRIQGDDELHAQQPGKQTITFLLVANISMFLTNLFEAEKAGISETVVNFYGKRSWVFLVRSFGPLTIFFRFHSSVCLAEIWKNVYAWKSQ